VRRPGEAMGIAEPIPRQRNRSRALGAEAGLKGIR
jgi:hypothetical protein